MLAAISEMVARLYHLIDNVIYHIRIKILISRGLIIGKNVTISRSVALDTGYPYLISIGDNCSLAEQVRLFAHDAATFKFLGGCTRLGKITIKENCFIGDRSTILPGVTIGPNVLVAAGSVVNRDIPPNSCVAGVPARVYAKFDEYIEKNRQQLETGKVFEYADLIGRIDQLDSRARAQIVESVQNGNHAYVRGFTGRNPYTWNAS
jgi:maltose O-acetyltransferase